MAREEEGSAKAKARQKLRIETLSSFRLRRSPAPSHHNSLDMPPKKNSKGSKAPSRAASGASTPAVRAEPVKLEPAVVGINFGQSFSSVSVINKVRRSVEKKGRIADSIAVVQEGLADCIANDDGERQIASALSFNGTEEVSETMERVGGNES